MRWMRGSALPALVVVLVFSFSPLSGGELELVVEDEELALPLEGASLRFDGAEYFSGRDGRVVLTVEDGAPGVLVAAYPGYASRRLVVPAGTTRFRVALRPGRVLESRELVLEERRPGESETRSGRSVAISGEDLRRTAEIGIIEDVMTSIKLLPGVGYSGMFNALPSIRGGDPGDLMAALDGFYISQPYYWGGGVSIFDPRMVSAAQLSHGVFSVRYGHTISGFLEVTSRKPSPRDAGLEAGISSSAANVNFSWPLGGRGGVIFMGKVTYWDPFVWAMQALSQVVDSEPLQMVNSVSVPPFIRSAALGTQYRFTEDAVLSVNGFFGSDGVGASYRNSYEDSGMRGHVDMDFHYGNYQGFVISALSLAPSPRTALRFTAGAGTARMGAKGFFDEEVNVSYNDEFLGEFGYLLPGISAADSYRAPGFNGHLDSDSAVTHVQGRVDFDQDLGGGFIFSAGAQELYNLWERNDAMEAFLERRLTADMVLLFRGNASALGGVVTGGKYAAIIWPLDHRLAVRNQGFNSSLYALLEFSGLGGFLGAELGLRGDHLFFVSEDFTVQTMPVLNPRLNLDFHVLNDAGPIDSFVITAGAGFFSSVNDNIAFLDQGYGIGDFEMKPNRAFTTVLGTKLDFAGGISLSVEGYFKYVFDRAYLSAAPAGSGLEPRFSFDAEGRIWGFDLQLQKMSSRYVDGWISYSFNQARYREPSRTAMNAGSSNAVSPGEWYYPSFHRFHNFNLVLNVKPSRRFHVAARFGFASGRPKSRVGGVYPYPVELVRWDDAASQYVEQKWDSAAGSWVDAAPGGGTVIQKFRRDSFYDDDERTTWSLPLDVKLSFFFFDRKSRVTAEMYLAAENILSLAYQAEANSRFNEYTGKMETGDNAATYELPVPMVSFGFTWTW